MASGDPWRYKAVTAFKAPQRFCRNEDLASFVNWTRSVGANCWRVFLQHKFLDYPTIDPWITPLDRVRPFVDYCASQGLYVELTVLCDTQKRNSGDDVDGFDQSDEWCIQRVRDILQVVRDAPSVFVELMNEPFANGGTTRVRRIVDALGLRERGNRPVLMASGIYPETGGEDLGFILPLDYIGDHPPRKPTWPIECGKIGKYVYAQCRVPHLYDEPIRFGENSNDGQETSVTNAEDAGGGIGLSSAGGTLHSTDGVHARVPGPVTTECARRFFEAMDRIPIECPTWQYEHDGTGGHPLVPINDETVVGEVASRVSSNMAYAVAAQPTDRWRPVARGGWWITDRLNQRGTILRLSK